MVEVTSQKKTAGGFSIAALVLGIVAFVLGWTGIFGLIISILAIIFGILGLAKKQGKAFSITGIVLGGIAFITALIVTIFSLALLGGAIHQATSTTQDQSAQAPQSKDEPVQQHTERKVSGQAATLGAGTFTVGNDIQPGLYDVTGAAGESGNFMTSSGVNEVLGSQYGVNKVRAELKNGDEINISGLNQVTFTPVSTPFVTTHQTTQLYAGNFVVGEDIGEGRYKVSPADGESGNFMTSSGVNEILGSQYGVKEVTVNLNNGDIIQLSGLNTVTFTAL